MAMMYVAQLTRPDVLLAISFLATKSQQPTDVDYNNAGISEINIELWYHHTVYRIEIASALSWIVGVSS